jgi:hypothetical protein
VQEVPPAGLGVPLAEAGGILEADLPQLLQLASHVLSLEATQQAQVRLGLFQPPTEKWALFVKLSGKIVEWPKSGFWWMALHNRFLLF